jgi:hypothetical protein
LSSCGSAILGAILILSRDDAMKSVIPICCLFLITGFYNRSLAFTGCAGDGPADSTVVAEYIFSEGAGNNTYNTGTDGPAGDAVLLNGASFSNNVPSANANLGWSINLPNTGTGSATPAVETSASYDPLAGATNFTIMAWVRRESAASNQNTSARIVSDTSSTALTNTTSGFEFRLSGVAGTLALRINGNEVSTSVGGIAPNSNTWHHVAVVYDGTRPVTNTLSRNVHFYVDGVQRGDGSKNHYECRLRIAQFWTVLRRRAASVRRKCSRLALEVRNYIHRLDER